MGEFPLIYFLVAQLWNIFGYHEFIFRLLNLLIFFTALFFLFKILEDKLEDSFWALIIVLLLFTSPLLVYYANNFLPNVPAFSFGIFGFYNFYQFYKKGKNSFLYLSCFFFLLAGLIKITSIIGFVCVVGIFLFERLHLLKRKDGTSIFRQPLKQIVPLAMTIIALLSWTYYVRYYNERNKSSIFLTSVLPLWNVTYNQFELTLLGIKENFKWNYFRPIEEIFLLIQFLLLFIYKKRVNSYLSFINIVLALSMLIFFLFFFQNLNLHDYYLIDFVLLVPAISLTFFSILKERFYKVYHSPYTRLIFMIFLIHNIDFARRRINARYESPLTNPNQSSLNNTLNNITPYLRRIGINRNDRVICFPDGSPNTSLYLMDQKGWTNFNVPMDSLSIRNRIVQGAKYLIICDNELYKNKQLEPFLGKKIGSYKTVEIFGL